MESSFLRESVELAGAGRNHGKGSVGTVLLEFCRKIEQTFRFSRRMLASLCRARWTAGPDWELCANWAGSRERVTVTLG